MAFFGPAVKFCASRTWHCAQTLATSVTPGGVAPWLPWHVLHVGADVSPRFSSASACTLDDQSANTPASWPNGFMRDASAWHCEQVVATFNGATGDRVSRTRTTLCAEWQSEQVATRVSPVCMPRPCAL